MEPKAPPVHQGINVERLARAVDKAREAMEPFREKRMVALQRYVGPNYGQIYKGKPSRTDDQLQPINLLELAVGIYSMQLSARNPRAMVITKKRSLKAAAADLEAVLNQRIEELKLAEKLRDVVKQDLFCLGAVKIGLEPGAEVDVPLPDGSVETVDPGRVYVRSVDFDDLILDMTAKSVEEMDFIGHRSVVTMEELREGAANGIYDPKAVEKVQPRVRSLQNETGDVAIESLSQLEHDTEFEFADKAVIYEIFLTRKKMLVTYAPTEGGTGGLEGTAVLLRAVKWQGPPNGPIRLLGMNKVPGNLMPLASASDTWMDGCQIAGNLMAKLSRQAKNEKSVTGVTDLASEDAQRVRDSEDGDMIKVNSPQGINAVTIGGVSQQGFAFVLQLINNLFVTMGNLDALGGLSPQADTLGQEQLVTATASKRIEDMGALLEAFTGEIMKDVAFYLWSDPVTTIQTVRRIPGVDVDVPVTFSPETRKGELSEYGISIHPYSGRYESPATKLRALYEMWNTIILPLQPQLEAQGGVIDIPAMVRLVAKLSGLEEEMVDIIQFIEPPERPSKNTGGSEVPGSAKPANTTRNYVRRSVSTGGTRAAQANVAAAMAMGGGKAQPKELAGLTKRGAL